MKERLVLLSAGPEEADWLYLRALGTLTAAWKCPTFKYALSDTFHGTVIYCAYQQPEHTGTYICEAIGYPATTPGARVSVYLKVEPCKSLSLLVHWNSNQMKPQVAMTLLS